MNDAAKTRPEPKLNIRPFIDGRYTDSKSTERFQNIDPSNESVLAEVPVGSAEDVDAAVAVARRTFEDGRWSGLPAQQRQAVLNKLADLLVEHAEELGTLDTLEMGKPISAAISDANGFSPLLLRSWAGFADKLFGNVAPNAGTTLSYNTWEPRGVVGAITPWNFPLVNAVFKAAPALAVGNSVVLKPSELSPSSALRLAELALEAGVPEGVLNIVPGLGTTTGAALASHPDVNLISFTGSTATGRLIMELCARSNGKPMLMECGGKSPSIVFDDVDNLDFVADNASNMFWNSGQVCSAHTRLLVHKSIKDALVKKMVDIASTLKPSDPWDKATIFGPLASPTQRDRVKGYLEKGLSEGAAAVLGGKDSVQTSGGCYVAPTIFDNVDSKMTIWREEIFGPVLSVQSFSTDDEALALANSTEYGLATTVWTRNLGRAKRFARGIKSGHVHIRTSGEEAPADNFTLGGEPMRNSGYGSEMGLRGLQSYSTLKAVIHTGA